MFVQRKGFVMANPIVVDEECFDNDALRSAIEGYKEATRRYDQDLDVEYLLKSLEAVSECSAVKVARNPVDKNHEWIHGTELLSIGKIDVDDEFHLTLHIRHDGGECTAETMLEQIENIKSKLHGTTGPVMLALSNEKKVKLTDAFSHSFVKDVCAGLPFDVVLGYFEDDAKEGVGL